MKAQNKQACMTDWMTDLKLADVVLRANFYIK